nr:hypothetical protein [Tanacetum cinerariifolium]
VPFGGKVLAGGDGLWLMFLLYGEWGLVTTVLAGFGLEPHAFGDLEVSFWYSTDDFPFGHGSLQTAKEKKTGKIDRLARSLLIQGLPNDIYSLIDSNKTVKDFWDALERQMHGSEYGDVNDALGYKKKAVVVTSDSLALVAKKTNVSKQKEKVVVSSDSKGSGTDDFSELKKITALLAKDFNQRKLL